MTITEDSGHHGEGQSKMEGERHALANMSKKEEKTNWRQHFIVFSVLISAYLVNGEHAQSVCNICTTVPAAIFTYKQLSDRATRIFAYKATLFYWSIHGILVAFDTVFVDAFGYFFGKFVLLVVLFFNVVYQHDVAKNLVEQQQHRSTMPTSVTTGTPIEFPISAFGSQIGLNTALTITDATQISSRSPYRVLSPIQSYLATASPLAQSPEMTAYLDTTYTHDGSLKTVASAEDKYEFGMRERGQTETANSSDLSDSSETTGTAESDAAKPIPAAHDKAGDQAGGSLRSYDYSASIMVKEYEEDLITNPPDYRHGGLLSGNFGDVLSFPPGKFKQSEPTIAWLSDELIVAVYTFAAKDLFQLVFKYPFTDSVTVYVTNKHTRAVMWALKTNAIKRMVAQPTCGILGKNATVHIKIGVTKVPPEESNTNDRIAIDYCLIDDDTFTFDRSFLYNAEDPFRRRKKLNVYYEN